MPIYALLIMLPFVAFRVARFISKDTLIEKPRTRFLEWINHEVGTKPGKPRRGRYIRAKVVELFQCPYCISVHVSGYTVLFAHFVIQPFPASPAWAVLLIWWLYVAGASLWAWEYVDGEK